MKLSRITDAPEVTSDFAVTAKEKLRKKARPSPLTLRLTAEEREKLEELAVGMKLSADVRGVLFAEESKRQEAPEGCDR